MRTLLALGVFGWANLARAVVLTRTSFTADNVGPMAAPVDGALLGNSPRSRMQPISAPNKLASRAQSLELKDSLRLYWQDGNSSLLSNPVAPKSS